MNDDCVIYYSKIVKELFKAQKETEVLRIFNTKNFNSYINHHDNWNGGIDYYTIEIGVSPIVYSELKKNNQIELLEECIASAYNDVTKGDKSVIIDNILIVPKIDIEDEEIIEEGEDVTFWNFGYYRMFISHLTADKTSAANLKTALSVYGISCFVAHEDIEPTKEWANEIEKALLTMNCLCAIITPKFNGSLWCDQEVGFALGHKVLVIPIRKGTDPYGLMGKYQGIQSKNKTANQLAKEIFEILCKNSHSKKTYTKILGNLFLNSKSSSEANKWIDVINSIDIIDKDVTEFINIHYLDNNNLNDKKIIEKANKLFTKYTLTPISNKLFIKEEIVTDDLPF
ncbi:MAG: toll/interleukin-1 receptor domain-containing protein [Bacteroidales bacterium]|nr:toll/interleukin-1 receptor domain-containing protein [Bacteroidales bacterium]